MNDLLTVWYRGKEYKMTVVDIKPEIKCTLIDSDVEVNDFDLTTKLITIVLKKKWYYIVCFIEIALV